MLIGTLLLAAFGCAKERARFSAGDGEDTDVSDGTTPTEPHVHAVLPVAEKASSCLEPGYVAHWRCEGCDALFADDKGEEPISDRAVLALPLSETHQMEFGRCVVCEKWEPYVRLDSGRISFGSYPQAAVEDVALADALSEAAGPLPTKTAPGEWTACEGELWYLDLKFEGVWYRGVYFTAYRSAMADSPALSAAQSAQYQNGYTAGAVHWFCYQPLVWRILEQTEQGALLLCESVIDTRVYYGDTARRTEGGETVWANNYARSDLRVWLNDTFFSTAFAGDLGALVCEAEVDNTVASTGYAANSYAGPSTADRVFLPSHAQLTNVAYGFAESALAQDSARARLATDYAKALGLGSLQWWLRSPVSTSEYGAQRISAEGAKTDSAVNYYGGVVPALWLSFDTQ